MTEHPAVGLKPLNMMTLCAACHNQIELRTGEPRLSRGCDVDGIHPIRSIRRRKYHPELRLGAAVGSMRRILVPCALLAAWVVASASTNAQGVRTEAPCSPVIERTQGLITNITVNFTGGCTAGITPAQLQQIIDDLLNNRVVSLESFEELAQRFGVTRMALTRFFRILGERNVSVEDLDAKLREIAAHHLTLLKQAEPVPGEDPQVEALKKAAFTSIGAGDYARAQALLEQASEADVVAARKAQDAVNKAQEAVDKAQDIANRRLVTAAKTKADLGQLKLTQLQYEAAAQEFEAAADLVPASEPLIRALYLAAVGEAAYRAGTYPRAESALTEALRIREKLLATRPPGCGQQSRRPRGALPGARPLRRG